MGEDKKSIVDILSATVTALNDIIIIIKSFSSDDDDAAPLHKKKGYIYTTISALRTSLLNDFLQLTDNELKIIDYVIQYRAITARNVINFLQVKHRQIYYYLERLHALGFITYSKVPLGDGPATRFYHFANLSPLDLHKIVISERAMRATPQHTEELEHITYKCSKCGGQLRISKDLKPLKRCPHCQFTKSKVWIRM